MKRIVFFGMVFCALLLSLLSCSSNEKCRVVFVVDGSVYYDTVISEGSGLTLPAEPSVDGSRFVGWYSGADVWDAGDTVKNSITLTARFEAIPDGDIGEPEHPDDGGEENIADGGNSTGDSTDSDSSEGSSGSVENKTENDNETDNENGEEGTDAHIHVYSSWIIDVGATCNSVGSKHIECTACGEVLATERIDKTEHFYSSEVLSPTCDTEGYTLFSCLGCASSYIENRVSPTGHAYTAIVTPPTCSSEGYTLYVCSSCADSYKSNITIPASHSFGALYTVSLATCTERGMMRRDCTVCKNYESVAINPLGHDYSNGICKRCGAYSCAILEYTLTDTEDGYILTSVDDGGSGIVEIPNEYEGLPIKGIGIEAFYGKSGIKRVVMGANIESIGDFAFFGCSGLEEVKLSSVLKEIGRCAFEGCSALKEIYLPSGLELIGDMAFAHCASLTELFIPSSVIMIGSYAFAECRAVESIEFGYSGKWSLYSYIGGAVLYNIKAPDPITCASWLTSFSTSYGEPYAELIWIRELP